MNKIQLTLLVLLSLMIPSGISQAKKKDTVSGSSLENGLVSYYKMEEASGTRLDSKGTNDLEDINSVSSTTGKIGVSTDFDPITSQYLFVQSDMGAIGTVNTSFTLSAWVKLNAELQTEQSMNVFSRYIKIGSEDLFMSGDYFNYAGSNFLRLYFGSGVNSEFGINYPVVLGTSAFHHVVFVVDQDKVVMELYLDGERVGKIPVNTLNSAGGIETSFLAIGVFRDGNANILPRVFDGQIDEVGVWNRTLDKNDVKNLYNKGNGIPFN